MEHSVSAEVDQKQEEDEEIVSDRPLNGPRTGLQFSASRIRKTLRAHPELTAHLPITDQGVVCLTAVLEYICAELCETSGYEPRDDFCCQNPIEISGEMVIKAVENDEEMLEALTIKLRELKREGTTQRLARCREATMEFRRQFAAY